MLLALAFLAGLSGFLLIVYRSFFESSGFRAVTPVRGEVVQAVYGLGTVQSGKVYDLALPIPTIIEDVFVTEGQRVLKGQPLVKLQSRSTLVAPFEGIVSELNLHTGEIASSRGAILTLIDPEQRYISVSLEQRDALLIKENQNASLSLESGLFESFKGKVTALYPRESEFVAKVNTPNLPQNVLPGMTLNVSIEVDRKQNALLVPYEAVSENEIVIRRNGQRKSIVVGTGLTDQQMVEILSGDLQVSDTVLIPKR